MDQTHGDLPRNQLPDALADADRAGESFRPAGRGRRPEPGPDQDAILAVDIETVPDASLMPSEEDWPRDRFPKCAWHKVVAVSFVQADILRDPDSGLEEYRVTACRSGGEGDWDEPRLLWGFWAHFATRRFRCVTWNGRSFDVPVLLQRSMIHGIAAVPWYRRGTRWSGYDTRFSGDWHADVMDAMSGYGSSSRMTLEEACALLRLPGKLGEHGAGVADLIAGGQLERVLAYCETDALNTFLVYLRHAFLTGRTGPGAHDRAVACLIDYLAAERGTRAHMGRYLDAWCGSSDGLSTFVSPT